MLQVQNLSVCFGTHKIIDDLSFSLSEGSWLMIVGPNGAGKSTVLNAVMQGISYSGHIFVDGAELRKLPAASRARKIGVLSQNHYVNYDFTVEEIVRLGRFSYRKGLFDTRSDSDDDRIEQALALTGMAEKRSQTVTTLSGGELQRTFLAQVLAQDPQYLFLDEPTNHLDLIYQKEIFSLISEWLKTPGKAVCSVVHDLSLARKYGSDALLMHHGKAVAQGAAAEIFRPEPLNSVYQMDVGAWMRELLGEWEDAPC